MADNGLCVAYRPIEEDCADEEEMAELVRDTVIHEFGRYFGRDDETMERIEGSEP